MKKLNTKIDSMKCLHKTFDVLEMILNQDGRPVTPSAISEKTGINLSTCMRIVKILLERGYVDNISRREGYAAGPGVYAMAMRESVYSKIIEASEAPLKKLAITTRSMANISIMQHGFRYILNYYNALPTKMPTPKGCHYSDHYYTATGWLLLSTLSEAEIDEVLRLHGMPEIGKWPKIDSRDKLMKELKKIREKGFICYQDGKIWIMGALIIADSYPPSAIGLGMSVENNPDDALALTRESADSIKSALNTANIFH